MSKKVLKRKIELLKMQISNLQQSGFFTEKEMDDRVKPLVIEKEQLEALLSEIESTNY